MSKYKAYTKQATSDKMMRIIKRERILSIIIAGYQSGNASLKRVNPTPEGMKRSDMSWHDANLTQLVICHHETEKDIFDYKLSLIHETEWLRGFKTYKKDDMYYAEWQDTRKLRVYYDWLHKARQFTIQKVLKYMYSPLFLAMYFIDGSAKTFSGNCYLHTGFSQSNDSSELIKWIKDIFEINSKIFQSDAMQDMIRFDGADSQQLISLITPYLNEIPGESFAAYCKQEASESIG